MQINGKTLCATLALVFVVLSVFVGVPLWPAVTLVAVAHYF